MISTENPSVDLHVYIMALKGYCEITVSLDIHAMNLKNSLRNSMIDFIVKV
jgi:hypothetical protein